MIGVLVDSYHKNPPNTKRSLNSDLYKFWKINWIKGRAELKANKKPLANDANMSSLRDTELRSEISSGYWKLFKANHDIEN